MTSPTLELPITKPPRHARRRTHPPNDRAEAIAEAICLAVAAVFVVAMFTYAIVAVFGCTAVVAQLREVAATL
ncbi:hypothetical protein Lfu02_66500 [Longispora fulva]|uniref:Uncharacterized protein n=1 Tax=Longispora fulva TaxID=619741 RepID=A0A8J7KHJ9_9ACTN|nr:hypothetical protein [Longispora fulva]MBG6138615.1 hypothetical protein [Longispora fulva]GIG62278.1 hypothetical protein Lfu02_66500 [Longispora fulva]